MKNIYVSPRSASFRGAATIALLTLVLAGCAALPASGPTGSQIKHAAAGQNAQLPFDLIEVDRPSSLPPAPSLPTQTLPDAVPQPTDLLGPGDVIDIAIYEAGVSLFGGGGLRTSASGAVIFDPTSTAEKLPPVRIDDSGYIFVPFVGRIRAAGLTVAQLELRIQNGLRGMSQDPQVLVSIEQSITNSITLAGEVTKPGRLVLATNRETLNDAIALAGGYRGAPKDIVAVVERDGQTFHIRLSDLVGHPERDFRISPGDRITLASRPESFMALGAANKSEDIPFPRGRITLAEAVALAGGANPNAGDASAIFVFRYIHQAGSAEKPVVYHVNMMKPGAYFLSQHFMMRDQDVLYVGNANANQPGKLVQLLSQLFLPIATFRSVVP